MVKRFLVWDSNALKSFDKDGLSSYLRRVGKCAGNHEEDKIAFLLKDRIMHLDDRETILDLLYGRLTATPTASSRTHQREIHLDLRELERSTTSSTKKDDLLNFIKGLEFENILQYVEIPRHPFRLRGAIRSPADTADGKPDIKGLGRDDFQSIFDALSDKGVRKILRLTVEDDDACLHRNEVIASLANFEVEEFQWRKLDIPTIVLTHGVPRARALYLFSSGNHSVLRDWSSSDGLNRLSLVRLGHLKLPINQL